MKFVYRLIPALILSLCVVSPVAQEVEAQPLSDAQRNEEIRQLRLQLETISSRLTALESRAQTPTSPTSAETDDVPVGMNAGDRPPAAQETAEVDRAGLSPFRGTTVGFGFDGYYGYNFNSPVGRTNLLRAYDVTSNSFNINQASIIVEHLATPEGPFGGRIDLQYGQATETLQGSAVNEQRPQVWRNLFQAYGSYLAPIGSGLQVDFGKFASSLGNEGNYSKDQVTYSRAYSFNYLPFYHMGFRTSYNVSPKLNVAYWLVNGANDTEDLNGFKSQAFLFTIKPTAALTWNVNYYFGQEANDAGATVKPVPDGREHIFDTYATWNVTPKLTLVGEADYILNRTVNRQQPLRVAIGSLTAKYALPRKWNLGARFEYVDDRGGLFSGATQALKEGTISVDHLFAPGFLARAEFRRDYSNQKFFLTDATGALAPVQSTATLGLVYWWGTKQGSW